MNLLRLSLSCLAIASFGWADQPHAVFVVGTPHYSPGKSMPGLAKAMEAEGFKTTIVEAEWNPERSAKGIPGLDVLAEADVAIFYLRFLTLPDDQLAHVTNYLESGKPVVGFRTTTHAFGYPGGHPQEAWNADFGRRAMGTKYFIHGKGGTMVSAADGAGEHELLASVELSKPRKAAGTLYLADLPDEANVLLRGTGQFKRTGEVSNMFGTHQLEAEMTADVAWTWTNEWGGRVFGTSLGHPLTFADPSSRSSLLTGSSGPLELRALTRRRLRSLKLRLPSRWETR